ncbi:TadE/TadG family type IV pilus assembly protein [Streptomyces sp. NPDC052015]|uniref:TadE/TadG family type IV pilus assembly protein n=1 Tax=Streptomyces sp. NPDC052015 TaxID=3154755 RepID=UPI00341F738F
MSYDGRGRRDRGSVRESPRGSESNRGRRRATGGDCGQVALEYLGFLPILLLAALGAVQLGLIAYTAQQAGTAARAGARSASLDQGADGACRNAVSPWLADGTSCTSASLGDEVRVTSSITIPSVIPGIGDFGRASKTATMPVDH